MTNISIDGSIVDTKCRSKLPSLEEDEHLLEDDVQDCIEENCGSKSVSIRVTLKIKEKNYIKPHKVQCTLRHFYYSMKQKLLKHYLGQKINVKVIKTAHRSRRSSFF